MITVCGPGWVNDCVAPVAGPPVWLLVVLGLVLFGLVFAIPSTVARLRERRQARNTAAYRAYLKGMGYFS